MSRRKGRALGRDQQSSGKRWWEYVLPAVLQGLMQGVIRWCLDHWDSLASSIG